ncbi:MAG: hypothetical protein M1823_000874 [Watsoniomyces obsoletus]|nr:MAG: hypothetical protein M1823_000874 [Watsoniomyces obsoletus]
MIYVEPVTVDRPSTDYPTKSFSHKPRRRKQSSRTPSSSSSSDSRSFFDDMNPPPPRPGHSTPQSSSTARSSKRNRTDGLKFLGPRDPGFADYILESAGIVFTNDNGLKLSPEDIPQDVEEVVVQTTTTATERGTSNGSATKDARGGVGSTTAGTTQTTTIERPAQAPSAPTTMTATTTQQPTTMMTAAPPSGTFLKLDQAIAGRIANQFDLLCNRDHSEQDVRWLVDRFLALADDYVSSYGPTSALSLRRNNWHLKRPGPDIPPESKHTFDWVIEPDATYSVSIRLFDPAHRAVIAWVDMEWLLADFKSVCPYLTLEYKCADKGGKESDARNQIAVASAIWLLQRQTLRAQLRESDAGTGKVGLGLDLDSEIYHYSIVIKSRFYTIFRASINGLKYEIQQIGSGFLDSVNGVMEFADWINAIHRWGLGRNARIFRAEVEKTWQLRNEQRDG